MFSSKRTRIIAAGAAAIVIGGGSYGIVAATSSSASATSASISPAGHFGSGGGSNARSGPTAGGSAGTVSSVSSSGFTLSTLGGQKVTVKEASTTTYQKGTIPASASAARQHRRIVPGRPGDSLQPGPEGLLRVGRPDPVGLQARLGDDRQRHHRG